MAISIGGNGLSLSTSLVRASLSHVRVLEGQVQVFDVTDFQSEQLALYCNGNAASPMAASPQPQLYLYGLVEGASFVDLQIFRDTGAVLAGELVQAIHHDGHGNPKRLSIEGGIFRTKYNATPLRFENADGVQLANVKVLCEGADPSGSSIVTFRAANNSISRLHINGLQAQVTGAKFGNGVLVAATDVGLTATQVHISNMQVPNAVTSGVLFSESGGGTVERNPEIQGCDFTGATTALNILSAQQVILAGNRGGRCWFVGTGSPEGVVTAGIGSLYTRNDGAAATTLYVKTSGTGNTGWTAK